MKNKRKLGVIGWILALVVYTALINWLTTGVFDFNIIEKVSFGVSWLATTLYVIVGILGIVGASNLIWKTFK